MACETEEVDPAPTPPPTTPEEDKRPLVFSWDNPEPEIRDGFAAIKDGKIGELGEGKIIEIVGCYFPGETAPEGFANMGLARANQIAKLFIPPLKPNLVVETSKLISDVPEGIQGDTLFEAILLKIKSEAPVDTVEIVEVDNTITILFPYGSSVREPDPRVDDYLSTLADRLKQTEETVSITGHTDDSGTIAFNQKLGLARAKHIRDILLDKGIDNGRLSIASKGEMEPVASNDTKEGSRQNRRVVLVLNQNPG